MSPDQAEIADFEEVEKAVGASPKDPDGSFTKFFQRKTVKNSAKD